MTLLEWVAAVAVVLGSAVVLWAVKLFDAVQATRSQDMRAPHRQSDSPQRRAA